MSIPDLPTPPEVSGESKSGLRYHILGTIQPTLAVELAPGQKIYSDTGAMSWMTATVQMNTTSGGGLGSMFKRAISGATAFILDFNVAGGPGQAGLAGQRQGHAAPLDREKRRCQVTF